MAFLYINSKGKPWTKHSYSAGNTFDQCPYKYFLQKIQGWREKDDKARFQFGKALEEAVQFYHDHNGVAMLADFERRWNEYKDKPLSFTKTEKDWDNLLHVGVEMLQLYQIRQPTLPIPLGANSVFQREYSKEVFPGDPNYGGIEHAGKLDIVCYVNPKHPLLPAGDGKYEGRLRPLIVDIKTMAQDFPENQGIAAYDVQLRCYSWLSGIRDVALLCFVKKGRSLKKGSSVTLLQDAQAAHKPGEWTSVFKAGEEAVIAAVEGDSVYLVRNDYMLEEMQNAQGKKDDGSTDQTKAAKARGKLWLETNGILCASSAVTKQRLQFNCGYVSFESADEAGLIAARQIIQIVNCWKTKRWPNTFGIRFPHDDKQDSYFRAFVMKDENLLQTGFEQTQEETLEELFRDDQPEEE